MRIKWLIPTLFTTLLCQGVPAAEQEHFPVYKPKVKTVAAFKNGLGFVFRSGTATLQNGWGQMEEAPPAALGSFWLGTTAQKSPVTDLVSYKERTLVPLEAVTLSELLGANVGRKVVLSFQLGEMKRVEGTLISVPQDRKPEPELFPAQPNYPYANVVARPMPEQARTAELVLLRVATNDRPFLLSINKSSIQAVELAEDSKTQAGIEKEVNRVKFHVANDPANADLTLAYLEKGIIWSPSYRVNIEKDKTAEISLDAVLANDMEDMENADVSFVVGYPNFLFADYLSPLTLQQSVGTFVQALMGAVNRESGSVHGNFMSQSIAYNTANFDASFRPTAGYTAGQPMPGDSSEDLYFYHKTGVTMKKGDRARYSVFNAAVPYEHLYQWDVPDTMYVDEGGYVQNPSSRKPPENQVWHVLRLENTTKQPWTTAPAFTVNGTMPLAQDTLQYTPPGARNSLKLTVATDLRAEQTLTETGRRTVNLMDRNYAEVTVSGKLKVTSWKNKEAKIVVRKTLFGEVLSADSDGKVKRVASRLTSVNPTSEIDWEFMLEGGKEKEIQYSYKTLVYR